MKSTKKLLAIVCALALIMTTVAVSISVFADNNVVMPKKMIVIDDFDGGVTHWREQDSSTDNVEFSSVTDHVYGLSGKSLKAVLTDKWDGVKTYGKSANIKYTGLAFWLYLPADLGVGLIVKVTLKTDASATTVNHEYTIPATQLKAGEQAVLVPWESFPDASSKAIHFGTEGAYVSQITLLLADKPSTSKTLYLDSVGVYRDDNAPVEMVPSTKTMPENYFLIDDFNAESNLGWLAHHYPATATTTFEYSSECGYGASGKSAYVTWTDSGYGGIKTKTSSSINLELKGDGLAFWVYNEGAELKDFIIAIMQNGVKYEAKITVTAGEGVYKVPYTAFVKNNVAVDVNVAAYQIEFTKNAASATYYIDELAFYKEDGSCVEHKYDGRNDADCNVCGDTRDVGPIKSTLSLPKGYLLIDNFNSASDLAWKSHHYPSTATTSFEYSENAIYGTKGKSAYVTWTESGYGGIKTKDTSSIDLELKGDGLAFWAYNEGSQLNDFIVVILQAGVKYEAKITLAAGEGVYKIPYTAFVKNNVAVSKDVKVHQIEFTKNGASVAYYIDELAFYNEDGSCLAHTYDNNRDTDCNDCGHIREIERVNSTVKMPKNYVLIEGFEDNTRGWNAHSATLEFTDICGYGTQGKCAYVSWGTSAWGGFKSKSGLNLKLQGDGFAFWAYNEEAAMNDFIVVLLQDNVKYEAKITLETEEAVYKIPWTDFVDSNGKAIDKSKAVSQIDFTKSAAKASYFIDEISFYSNPKKPAKATVVFDTSTKSSASAIGGGGNGAKGGMDTVRWKLYDIENDPRFVRAGWFIADDVTSGIFQFANVTQYGTVESADISSAYDFGNLVFWIKSEAANRSLKVCLRNSEMGGSSDYVKFTVTKANKWQQVVIPIKDMLKTETILLENPDFLSSISAVAFTGQGLDDSFKYGENFKIAGLRIYDSDVPDYSKYANLDTEPTQPDDDGKYATDSELIGRVSFEMDSYSGNSNFGEVTKEKYSEFAQELAGVKIVAGAGIKDKSLATKGLSIWFGDEKGTFAIDASTLENGYFSMWVRSNRAGMTFYWFIMDDTDNDAKTTMTQTYTIKKANQWEEVRVRLTDITAKGMLDLEYLNKLQIRTGYGAFNWSAAYEDAKWFNTGDTLEITAARITEGKPVDPFVTVLNYPVDEDEPENDTTEDGTTPDDETDNEIDNNKADADNQNNEKPFNVWPIVIGIAAGVVGLAVLVIVIVLIAKKKKA